MIMAEAATSYLNSLAPAKRASQSAGVSHFVMWYGQEKNIKMMSLSLIGRYNDDVGKNSYRSSINVDAVKKFLAYAFKSGWTKEDFSISVRSKTGMKNATNKNSVGKNRRNAITQEGYDNLIVELERLKLLRNETVEQIAEAAADKDLRENAPYHAAKEKCGLIEGQIIDIEDTLKHSYIMTSRDRDLGKVNMGDVVSVLDEKNNRSMVFTIVSTKEVDMSSGKISVDSPIGRALLGQKVHQKVEVQAPAGIFCLKIMKIN